MQHFQTRKDIAEYMVNLIPKGVQTVFEPTPGDGNIVKLLKKKYTLIYPKDYFNIIMSNVDCVIMNPPFTPMSLGYKILFECMSKSKSVIALMPWLTIINSERRTDAIFDYGLKSITHLPRSAFQGSRVPGFKRACWN